jgi:hypothetical protein
MQRIERRYKESLARVDAAQPTVSADELSDGADSAITSSSWPLDCTIRRRMFDERRTQQQDY